MRRRFFVNQIRNGQAEVEGEEAQHLTRVLRVEPGQRYEISDNQNVFLAEIETARKSQVVFRTLEKLPSEAPRVHIALCAALIKFDHFEWMIEKATELGVAEIVPVIATRSTDGLEKAAPKRIERWRKIAMEASQQSRRAFLPEIHDPWKLSDALRGDWTYRYVLDEEPGGQVLSTAAPQVRATEDRVALLIGPEGGWTEEEREAFQPWTRITLGPLILRAETAALAALSIVADAWRH